MASGWQTLALIVHALFMRETRAAGHRLQPGLAGGGRDALGPAGAAGRHAAGHGPRCVDRRCRRAVEARPRHRAAALDHAQPARRAGAHPDEHAARPPPPRRLPPESVRRRPRAAEASACSSPRSETIAGRAEAVAAHLDRAGAQRQHDPPARRPRAGGSGSTASRRDAPSCGGRRPRAARSHSGNRARPRRTRGAPCRACRRASDPAPRARPPGAGPAAARGRSRGRRPTRAPDRRRNTRGPHAR